MTKSTSLPQMLLDRVAATPDALAYRFPHGDGWAELTWAQTLERVRAIACGLIALGIGVEDRVGLLCSTRLEWILCDLGALCAGAAVTTVYPNTTADDCAYIIADSGCRLVIVEDAAQAAKLPAVERVVVISGTAPGALTLAEVEERGRAATQPFEERARSLQPSHLATIIYTSGTTGRPKGVELTHDVWAFEADAIAELTLVMEGDESYLWLPLAHVFGKVLLSAQVRVGVLSTIDGRMERLLDNLPLAKPTLMAGVPRVFEKMYNRIVELARAKGPLAYAVFRWALETGHERARAEREGRPIGRLLAARHRVADQLVLAKIRAGFGGRIRVFSSGSAPLSRDIAEFFHAVGLLILEGYGLTESGAASFCNRPDAFRFGTVGKPLPGVEVKIAEDGEVLLRSRGLMRGYRNLPEATAAALVDGWLCTGDIGEVDAQGFLRITDRKKDLIKTSGGKFISPQNMEGKLRLISPLVSHALVHGEGRNFCTALITLDLPAVRAWAKRAEVAPPAGDAWAAHPALRAEVERAVAQLNAGLASFETIKAFHVLPEDFTIASGELTTSLKMRRRVIEQKHRAVLDRFYEGQVQKV